MNKNYARVFVSAAVLTVGLGVGAFAFAKSSSGQSAPRRLTEDKTSKKLAREWVWERKSISFDDMYAR